MAVDVQNFIIDAPRFEGLYQAGETLERRRLKSEQQRQQQQAQRAGSAKFLAGYLNPDDFLTGTHYDPLVNQQLNDLLTQGAELAQQGASPADLMMALGPGVKKLSEYSTKAKLIKNQIEQGITQLKNVPGFNLDAVKKLASQRAFFDEQGKLKDISQVDPSMDFIGEVIKSSPELVTSATVFDEYVKNAPLRSIGEDITKALGPGKTRQFSYEAKLPPWMDIQRTEKGEIATDQEGKPLGIDIVSTTIEDDEGKPHKIVAENVYQQIVGNNPGLQAYVRGQVREYFKKAGAKEIPPEGSPQWDMMARAVVYDELKSRDKSYFKFTDKPKETAAATKAEIAQTPALLEATRKYYEATRKPPSQGEDEKKPTRTTTYADIIANAFNFDPDYTGDPVTHNGKTVLDLTPLLPDLKYGNEPDDMYKSVYQDPQSRSLILIDRQGNEKVIPENKIFQELNKLSGYNNLNPAYIRNVMEKAGYEGGRFTKKSTPPKLPAPKAPVRDFEKMKFKDMKGIETSEGKVIEADERSGLNPRAWVGDKYYLILEKDGREVKKTFPTKKAMADYLKKATEAPASQSKADTTSSNESLKGILD